MEIAREVQVHVFHRHNLRIAAASCAALHPEVRAQARFANTNHRFLANRVQAIAKAHGCCGLAFARRRRVDSRHKDELAVFVLLHRVDKALAHFGLVVAVRQQMLARDPDFIANLLDRALLGFAGNFNVGLIAHSGFLFPIRLLLLPFYRPQRDSGARNPTFPKPIAAECRSHNLRLSPIGNSFSGALVPDAARPVDQEHAAQAHPQEQSPLHAQPTLSHRGGSWQQA